MGRIPRFLKWAAQSKAHTGKQRQNILGLPRYHRRLACEALETRRLLSVVPQLPAGWQATPIADPIYFSTADASGSKTPLGLTPNQIRGAYGLGSYTSGVLSNGISFAGIPGDGRGQTIAIVDAYDDPNAASDLNHFSSEFGLPTFNAGAGSPTFQKLNQDGQTSPLPSTDPNGPYRTTGSSDWEQEESLDIEWAHVMAPLANIILFEANSDTGDLYTAVQTAASTPGVVVVSMSWGGGEFSGESSYDATYFTTPPGHVGGSATMGGAGLAGGVTFLASAGDNGAYAQGTTTITTQYPACSPNLVAVGGTKLSVSGSNPNYTYNGETAWGSGTDSGFTGGGGGGISEYENQPVYQNGVVSAFSTTHRTYPDISADADPNSGVPIYDSWDFGASTPWLLGYEGGTSLACPLCAGMITVADEGRAIAGEGSLDGPSQTLPMLYSLSAADFHDITIGGNGYAAGPGYDLATGIGSPVGNLLLPALIGKTTAAPVVTSISPPSGPLAGGTQVTISGTNLANATLVDFGKAVVNSTNFISDSAIQIVLDSPAGKVGTVNVAVTTAGGTAMSPDQFSYVAAPTVTKIKPAKGPETGSTLVKITGKNLADATAVTFGTGPTAVVVTSFISDTATSIQVDSPSTTVAGPVYVTVTTAGGTSKTSSADKFTYAAAAVIIGNGPVTPAVNDLALLDLIGPSSSNGMTQREMAENLMESLLTQ